jgi:hypothetical protein
MTTNSQREQNLKDIAELDRRVGEYEVGRSALLSSDKVWGMVSKIDYTKWRETHFDGIDADKLFDELETWEQG